MGMKRTLFVLLLLIPALLLSSCTTGLIALGELYYSILVDYNIANIDVGEIQVEKAKACSFLGFYLSSNNILYSTGANSDAGCYVYYANQRKGIVAENVKDFGIYSGGGYYITCQNDLYVWNREKILEIGYNKNRTSQKIQEGVIKATAGRDSVTYIDENSRLCVIGALDETIYSKDNPYIIDEDVVHFFGITEGAYVNMNGEVKFFGSGMEDYPYYSSIQNLSFENPEMVEMFFEDTYCLILENGRLHFYGDYSVIDGNEEPGTVDDVILLDNVTRVSCAKKTIAAVDESGDGYIFGECISNGLDNVETPE